MSGVVLATGGYDQTVRIWDPTSGTATRTIRVPDSQVNALAVSPDKKYVVAALNPVVKIFDITARGDQPVAVLDGHSGNVTAVGFDVDARWIFTSGEDGTVRIFDPRAPTNACQRVFEPPPPTATAATGTSGGGSSGPTTTPTATHAMSASPAHMSTAAPAQAHHHHHHAAPPSMVMPRQQQHQAANTSSWTDVRRNAVNTVVLHPSQVELVAGDQGGRIRLYDVGGSSKEPMAVLMPEPDVSVRSVCVSGDGNRVMMANDQGNVYQFNSSTPDTLLKNQLMLDKVVRAHDAYILKIQLSPDMKYLATASADHQCKIWRTADMKCLKVLAKHQRWVWDAAFSEDSKYLVTGSSDHSARLWDLTTGEMVRNFVANKAIVAVALNDRGSGGGGGGGGAGS